MKSKDDILLIDKKLIEQNLKNSERRKLEAIRYNLEGLETNQIAERINISQRSVERYIKEYKEKGIKEIVSGKKSSYKRKISKEVLERLKVDLKKSPTEFRFVELKWNNKILNRYLKSDYSIKVSLETCRKLLLKEQAVTENKESTESIRDVINDLIADKNNNVWYVDELYIGVRKYKIRGKAKAYVLLGINAKTNKIKCRYFSTLNLEPTYEVKKFVFKIAKNFYKKQTYILIDKNSRNRNAFSSVRLKQSSKINNKLKIVYVNASTEVSPLIQIKKKVIKDLDLVDKEGKRKTISRQAENRIKKYLDNMKLDIINS